MEVSWIGAWEMMACLESTKEKRMKEKRKMGKERGEVIDFLEKAAVKKQPRHYEVSGEAVPQSTNLLSVNPVTLHCVVKAEVETKPLHCAESKAEVMTPL